MYSDHIFYLELNLNYNLLLSYAKLFRNKVLAIDHD